MQWYRCVLRWIMSHSHMILTDNHFIPFFQRIGIRGSDWFPRPNQKKKRFYIKWDACTIKAWTHEKLLIWSNWGPEQPVIWQIAVLTDGVQSKQLGGVGYASCWVVCSGNQWLTYSHNYLSGLHHRFLQKCAMYCKPGKIRGSGARSVRLVSTGASREGEETRCV